MEAVNGVSEVDKGGPPAPSPLTGCYLLIVVGEPHSKEHKDIILRRIAKGLLSWDASDCYVDLEKELAIITEQAPEGEDARYGERLIQFASENLVTEVLIHPAISTLSQCMKNLLSSFTRHRHIIHAGYTFAGNGSWILQDGTFSLTDFSEAFQEIEVQRVLRAYDNTISLDIHCSTEGDWTRLPKETFTKNSKVRVNPDDVLTSGSPAIVNFLNYISPFLIPTDIEMLLESSDVVGNIRFSHPTLYVFPGGQGDAALFGINGFNMLVDGGFARKACFWDFVRHLDRLDAVLLTRLNNSNVNGISSVLRRKRHNTVYPQIGHFFCNIQERKAILSPDGDKDKDPLLVNLFEEGQDIMNNLRQLNLQPQSCYRDVEPINLYHKVGHGTLDMYILSPTRDSKEVREFLQKWNTNDQKLFATQKNGKEFVFPTYNLVSICALLVWQPANTNDNITRILFPGSSPQHKIFEGLDKIKQLDCIKYPSCSAKTLSPSIIKTKLSKPEKIIQEQKEIKLKPQPTDIKPKLENKIIEENVKNGHTNGLTNNQIIPDKIIKKHDSTESDKSGPQNLDVKKTDAVQEMMNGKAPEEKPVEKAKPKAKPEQRPKPEVKPNKNAKSIERKVKAPLEKKASPTTPKKTVETKMNGDVPSKAKPPSAMKTSPSATPAKSAKEANNRKVFESKYKSAPKKEAPKPNEKKEAKPERKPISRRPKGTSPIGKTPESPVRKISELHKVEARKPKLEKECTTDSSTVSTPSADVETAMKKDLSKLTPEELEQIKERELAELKEEQEVVKEIEAVFRKSETKRTEDSDMRKVKSISIDDKTEGDGEEYLIIEKEEIEHDSLDEKDTKESETQKHMRDSEESEKQRKLSDVVEGVDVKTTEADKDQDLEEKPKEQVSVTNLLQSKEEKELNKPLSKDISVTSPDDKIEESSGKKMTDKEQEEDNKELNVLESQPDEKYSTPIESGATTAPTLPEDERIPLDEIKEDNGDQVIEEKYVKEDTKEKEIPVVQLPPKTVEAINKIPNIVGIRLDRQTPMRDIVKTPDEVADLPVHEVVDIEGYDQYQVTQAQTPKQEEVVLKDKIELEQEKPDNDAFKKDDTEKDQETKEHLKDVEIKPLEEIKDHKTVAEKVEEELKDDKEIKEKVFTEEKHLEEVEEDQASKKETKVEEVKFLDHDPITKEHVKVDISDKEIVEELIQEKHEDLKDVVTVETLPPKAESLEEKHEKIDVEAIKTEEKPEVTEEKLEDEGKITTEVQSEKPIEKPIDDKKFNILSISLSTKEIGILEKDEKTSEPEQSKDDKTEKEEKVADVMEKIDALLKHEEYDMNVKQISHKVEVERTEVTVESHTFKKDVKEVTKETEDEKDKDTTEDTKLEKTDKSDDIVDEVQHAKKEEFVEAQKVLDDVKNELDELEADVIDQVEDQEMENAVVEVLHDAKDILDSVSKTITDENNGVMEPTTEHHIDIQETEKAIVEELTDHIPAESKKIVEEKERVETVMDTSKSEVATNEEAEAIIEEITKDIMGHVTSDEKIVQEVIEKDSVTELDSEQKFEDTKEIEVDVETAALVDPTRIKEEFLADKQTSIQSFREDSLEIRKIEKKLQELKDSFGTETPPLGKTEPKLELDVVDKLELGRKSPKEREQDVAKIVASVAEVLKSDAPLEEFEGKIPLGGFNAFTPYTTELRETHITTLESPIRDVVVESTIMDPIEEEKSLDPTSMFINEERKVSELHTDYDSLKKEDDKRVSSLLKDSTEFIQATSKMLSDIKQSTKIDSVPKEDYLETTSTVENIDDLRTHEKSSSGRITPETSDTIEKSIDFVKDVASSIVHLPDTNETKSIDAQKDRSLEELHDEPKPLSKIEDTIEKHQSVPGLESQSHVTDSFQEVTDIKSEVDAKKDIVEEKKEDHHVEPTPDITEDKHLESKATSETVLKEIEENFVSVIEQVEKVEESKASLELTKEKDITAEVESAEVFHKPIFDVGDEEQSEKTGVVETKAPSDKPFEVTKEEELKVSIQQIEKDDSKDYVKDSIDTEKEKYDSISTEAKTKVVTSESEKEKSLTDRKESEQPAVSEKEVLSLVIKDEDEDQIEQTEKTMDLSGKDYSLIQEEEGKSLSFVTGAVQLESHIDKESLEKEDENKSVETPKKEVEQTETFTEQIEVLEKEVELVETSKKEVDDNKTSIESTELTKKEIESIKTFAEIEDIPKKEVQDTKTIADVTEIPKKEDTQIYVDILKKEVEDIETHVETKELLKDAKTTEETVEKPKKEIEDAKTSVQLVEIAKKDTENIKHLVESDKVEEAMPHAKIAEVVKDTQPLIKSADEVKEKILDSTEEVKREKDDTETSTESSHIIKEEIEYKHSVITEEKEVEDTKSSIEIKDIVKKEDSDIISFTEFAETVKEIDEETKPLVVATEIVKEQVKATIESAEIVKKDGDETKHSVEFAETVKEIDEETKPLVVATEIVKEQVKATIESAEIVKKDYDETKRSVEFAETNKEEVKETKHFVADTEIVKEQVEETKSSLESAKVAKEEDDDITKSSLEHTEISKKEIKETKLSIEAIEIMKEEVEDIKAAESSTKIEKEEVEEIKPSVIDTNRIEHLQEKSISEETSKVIESDKTVNELSEGVVGKDAHIPKEIEDEEHDQSALLDTHLSSIDITKEDKEKDNNVVEKSGTDLKEEHVLEKDVFLDKSTIEIKEKSVEHQFAETVGKTVASESLAVSEKTNTENEDMKLEHTSVELPTDVNVLEKALIHQPLDSSSQEKFTPESAKEDKPFDSIEHVLEETKKEEHIKTESEQKLSDDVPHEEDEEKLHAKEPGLGAKDKLHIEETTVTKETETISSDKLSSDLAIEKTFSGKSTPDFKDIELKDKSQASSGKVSPERIVKEEHPEISQEEHVETITLSETKSASPVPLEQLIPVIDKPESTEQKTLSQISSGRSSPEITEITKDFLDTKKSPILSRKSTPEIIVDNEFVVLDRLSPEKDIFETEQKSSVTDTKDKKEQNLEHISQSTIEPTKSSVEKVDVHDTKQSFEVLEKMSHAETTDEPSSILSVAETSPLIQTKETETKSEQILSRAGPSGMTEVDDLKTEEIHISRKSTPDIADVAKASEKEELSSGRKTPPTAPVSPVVKDKFSTSHDKQIKDDILSGKVSEIRSYTPASDDCDISSGQVSRVLTTEDDDDKQVYSDDEEIPGSPLSATSQIAHSISSQYDFEDSVRGATVLDPMSTSFYGALPDDPVDLDKEIKVKRIEEKSSLNSSPSHIYEITTARYSGLNLQTHCDEEPVRNVLPETDIMSASFIGSELPTDTKDPIASWGKPLGLPSPAPINDNKGTPKKERKIPSSVVAKNKLNEDKKNSDSKFDKKGKKMNPIYVDLTYVPHNGNSNYSYVDFFKRVRARYYVFSGIEPSKEVYNALLEAKQTWDDKDLEVTIIPTYDTDVLGYWVAENEELLNKYKIDLSPSASRCTINLQDHETSCSAYRLEFS